MTRGYYVIEKGSQVLKAVYLSGDAYLDCGYGERILKAFAENGETEYLDYLFDEITPQEKEDVRDIVPEWYRITKKSNHRPCIDYGYVLKNNTLRVYYYGKLLFVVKKDTANKWINAIKHTNELYNHYLYSNEKLGTLYENEHQMWRQLQTRFDSGEDLTPTDLLPQKYSDFELYDDHCVDVWYRDDAPSYEKKLSIRGVGDIKFIAKCGYGQWKISIQLPYVRAAILGEFKTETAAMKKLRELIREKADDLKEFAIIANKYNRIAANMRTGISNGKDVRPFDDFTKDFQGYLDTHTWFTVRGRFNKKEIMKELRRTYDRCIERRTNQ